MCFQVVSVPPPPLCVRSSYTCCSLLSQHRAGQPAAGHRLWPWDGEDLLPALRKRCQAAEHGGSVCVLFRKYSLCVSIVCEWWQDLRIALHIKLPRNTLWIPGALRLCQSSWPFSDLWLHVQKQSGQSALQKKHEKHQINKSRGENGQICSNDDINHAIWCYNAAI